MSFEKLVRAANQLKTFRIEHLEYDDRTKVGKLRISGYSGRHVTINATAAAVSAWLVAEPLRGGPIVTDPTVEHVLCFLRGEDYSASPTDALLGAC